MLGDTSTKSWEAEHLTLRVVRLYQPVAVEQDAVTLYERDLSLLIAHPWHKPQGHPSCPQLLAISTMPQVGQIVARVGVAQATAVGIEDGVEAGDEHVEGDASQQRLVDPLEYLARRRGVQGLSGELQHAAGGGHHQRSRHALACCVPGDQS